MLRNSITRAEAAPYLEQLHACFELWQNTMLLLMRDDEATIPCADIIAAIGPIAQAHHDLAQLAVASSMRAAHRAALGLLQSAMDVLGAVAAENPRPGMEDLSEQLTIFQTELVRFAERAGVIPER